MGVLGLLGRLQPSVPRSSLLTIYKIFMRGQSDYVDVISNHFFMKNLNLSNEMLAWQ